MKFFSNPIICLDGDPARCSFKNSRKTFPLISEENKIYFSVLPEKNDPDDFIQKHGKDKFLNLLKDKEIIQTYLWNYHLKK